MCVLVRSLTIAVSRVVGFLRPGISGNVERKPVLRLQRTRSSWDLLCRWMKHSNGSSCHRRHRPNTTRNEFTTLPGTAKKNRQGEQQFKNPSVTFCTIIKKELSSTENEKNCILFFKEYNGNMIRLNNSLTEKNYWQRSV